MVKNAVTVRERMPADEVQAAEVDRLATADLRKVYRPTSEANTRRSALLPATLGLVATVQDRLVGVVQYRIADGQLWFLSLGVDPGARRQGVARAMIQHLEQIARASGCAIVGLHTVRETGNVEVFERLGFAVESEASAELFESERFPELFEVTMIKRI